MRTKFFLLGLAAFALPLGVQAQGIKDAQSQLTPIAQKAGLSDQGNLENVVGTIVNAALSLVGLIFLVLMVYAGFTWMLAQGDEGKIDKSKEIIKACIIGLIITASAYAITFFVTNRFEQASNGGGLAPAGKYCLYTSADGAQLSCLNEEQMNLGGDNLDCQGMWYDTLSECETAMSDAAAN